MLYPAELRGRNISLLPRFFGKEKQKKLAFPFKTKEKGGRKLPPFALPYKILLRK